MLAPPVGQVGHLDAEPLLQESQGRGVVEHVVAHPPPRLHGEATIVGTRKPSPIGSPLTNSFAVPGSGTGGGTWSKKPPFSSIDQMNTVRAHTFGSASSAPRYWWVRSSPAAGGYGGCSDSAVGATIHDT